jgi:hypothetical protein
MDIETKTIAAKIGSATAVAERSTDVALADTAEMLSQCVRARVVLGLPAHEGQRSVISLGKAVNQLIGVQNDIRRAHAENKRLGELYALTPDEDDCPWPATGEADEHDVPLAEHAG